MRTTAPDVIVIDDEFAHDYVGDQIQNLDDDEDNLFDNDSKVIKQWEQTCYAIETSEGKDELLTNTDLFICDSYDRLGKNEKLSHESISLAKKLWLTKKYDTINCSKYVQINHQSTLKSLLTSNIVNRVSYSDILFILTRHQMIDTVEEARINVKALKEEEV